MNEERAGCMLVIVALLAGTPDLARASPFEAESTTVTLVSGEDESAQVAEQLVVAAGVASHGKQGIVVFVDEDGDVPPWFVSDRFREGLEAIRGLDLVPRQEALGDVGERMVPHASPRQVADIMSHCGEAKLLVHVLPHERAGGMLLEWQLFELHPVRLLSGGELSFEQEAAADQGDTGALGATEGQRFAAAALLEMDQIVARLEAAWNSHGIDDDSDTLICLHNKLASLRALSDISRRAEATMREAEARGDEEAARYELRKIGVALSKARQVGAEADACIVRRRGG